MDPNSRMVSTLGEAGGAIGIVCGLLLICMYVFVRYLMERSNVRDGELVELNRQLQEALVANAEIMIENAAAMSSLVQILQQRSCLLTEKDTLEEMKKVNQVTKKKKEEK